MSIKWSKAGLMLGSLSIALSPTLIPFSSVSAASGEFRGTWTITRDFTLDGTVDTNTASNYPISLNSHANYFVGSYSSYTNGTPNDSIFEGETYYDAGRSTKIINFRQRDETYYVVHSGKLIAPNKYQGTWYDNAGNSGDFLLTTQSE